MRITFWGTRGSLAVPGPETLRYGAALEAGVEGGAGHVPSPVPSEGEAGADALTDLPEPSLVFVPGTDEGTATAGYRLAAPDGHRVGSLCVLDRRARDLTPGELQLLEDLAHLAEEELARSAA